MVDAHQGDPPLTLDDAAQRLKDTWARENQRKTDAWHVQLQQDLDEQDELDRRTRAAQEAQVALQEKEAEEARKEAEKKKPKLNPLHQDRVVAKWIGARPATYALNKLNSFEYIELDYFTTKGCREAAADSNKSVSQDTLTFTQVGDAFAIRPMAAMRPSKQIRNDEDLSWEEMMDAKNVMLHFMAKSGVWQDEHATALATFYINLDYHQRKEQKNGKSALLLYQSRVRREWYDALKRDEGFNIAVIEEDLLRALAEEVNNSIQDRENAVRDREVEQVRYLGLSNTMRLADQVRSPFFPSSLFRTNHALRYRFCCRTLRSPIAICQLPFATCQLPFAVHPSALCYALAMTPPGDYTPAMTPPGAYTPASTRPVLTHRR